MELTVKDILEHLKTLPQDAVCITTNSNTMEQSGNELMHLPTLYEHGEVETVTTRDAFDRTPYDYKRYSISGGSEKFVKF